MTRFSTRRLAVFGLLAVLALTFGGCSNPFDPNKGKPTPIEPADYHDRLTPEDVLHNLRTAYIWTNPVEYLDCLSEDFIFYPDEADVQDPNAGIPPEWYKSQETEMHQNMFADDSNVESISLTLTITNIAYDDGANPDDPRDDTCVCIVDVDLRVNLLVGDLTYLATAPSEFDMRVDIDQSSGEDDPIWWEINYWYDLGDQGRGRTAQDPNVEVVSLSQLKNMFKQ